MEAAEEVLSFWLGAGPEAWYKQDDAFDAEIRDRFGALWEAGAAGALDDWATNPRGALALIILLDQFPRNMFRGEARAFATDALAQVGRPATRSTAAGTCASPPERQFFYMPFMHSERLTDQDHCVRLMARNGCRATTCCMPARIARSSAVHRFPYRNAALGRRSTAERAFLDDGGYGEDPERAEGRLTAAGKAGFSDTVSTSS
jgi:uncharacterized protein (DUF924 family)